MDGRLCATNTFRVPVGREVTVVVKFTPSSTGSTAELQRQQVVQHNIFIRPLNLFMRDIRGPEAQQLPDSAKEGEPTDLFQTYLKILKLHQEVEK